MIKQATIPEGFNRYWRVAGLPGEDPFAQCVGYSLGRTGEANDPDLHLLRFPNGELGRFPTLALFPPTDQDLREYHRERRKLKALHVDYLVLMQNPWSPRYAGRPWPREHWLRALRRCMSGKRLQVIERACPGKTIWYENTTPICGATAREKVPANLGHVRYLVDTLAPRRIVALGDQAGRVVQELKLPRLLLCPHPASRTLTTALYERAGELLRDGWKGSLQLVQHKGHFEQLQLENA